jgi:hypothetical protein
MTRMLRWVPWLTAVAALGVLVGTSVWLEREDALVQCAAVAVLNGDQPARVDAAARIARSGYADEVWLTNDPRSGTGSSTDAGTVSNVRRLAAHGVAPTAIRVLDGAAQGSRAELRVIRDHAQRHTVSCAIVVTSPAHVARVRMLWRRVPDPKPVVILRHASDPGYTGAVVRARELALLVGALVGWGR